VSRFELDTLPAARAALTIRSSPVYAGLRIKPLRNLNFPRAPAVSDRIEIIALAIAG
jgi:hypothetical protein